MKAIKYLLIFAIGFSSLTSCVDDYDPSAANATGNNVAGFLLASQTVGGIANGDTYDHDIRFSVKGPTSGDLSADVVVTIEADPSSTAIEGVHYEFATNSITLSNGNSYLGQLPITMLSEGIVAPLDASPILTLRVTNAATGENVVGNGQLLIVTFNYLCFSDLAGSYSAAMEYTAYDGSVSMIYYNDIFTETGTGEYRTSRVGHWTAAQLGYTPGYSFSDVCNEIIVNGQNLVEAYGNWVDDLGVHGSVDTVTGIITIDYSICYPAGDSNCRYYKMVYTPL
jgi:hypothetical protein